MRTYFLYSDEGLIGEYNASGVEIRTYGYAPDSVWTTNPLFQKVGSNYYWYQNDHLGTPQKMIDSSGAVVWSASYDAFGKAEIQVAAIENNLRSPGQYCDQETGHYYNYFRYYDPQIGRYMTPDPIGLEGGINVFVFVGNNPANYGDPPGLQGGAYPVADPPGPGPYYMPRIPDNMQPFQLPVANLNQRVPRRQPAGVRPFVGTELGQLEQYTFLNYGPEGVGNLNYAMNLLTLPEAAKIPCGKTEPYVLYFTVDPSGVHPKFLAIPGQLIIYEPGSTAPFDHVPIVIPGRKR